MRHIVSRKLIAAATVLVAGACIAQLGALTSEVRTVEDDLTDTRDCLFRAVDCTQHLSYYADSADTPVSLDVISETPDPTSGK